MTMERMHTKEEKLQAFGRLLDVMDRLREECPWDRKQTNDSLRANTIEETYELCDALIRDDQNEICKELGDVLLHIVFYGRIGEEKQQFDIADICNKLCDKLIFRHPHVYGEAVAKDAEAVLESWEQFENEWLNPLVKKYRVHDWGLLSEHIEGLKQAKKRDTVWKSIPEKKRREVYEYLKTLSREETEKWYERKFEELGIKDVEIAPDKSED